MLDGAIYRGPHGVSGELGHTTVVVDGEPCGMCMVEDNGPIISHATIRFVPHAVLP